MKKNLLFCGTAELHDAKLSVSAAAEIGRAHV